MDVKGRERDTNPPTASHRRPFGTRATWLRDALAVVSILAIAAATIWVAGRQGGSSRRPDDVPMPNATTPPDPSEEVLPGGTISLVDPATGGQTVVLAQRARVANAEVSPDGDHVVYEHRDRDGHWQIFVLSPTGPRPLIDIPIRLTDMPNGAYDPTWSPDGDEIAFAASPHRGASTDIFVMDADGSRIRRLVGTPGVDGDPDWSPDGSSIVFHGRPNHVEDVWKEDLGGIWIVSVRTGTLTRLNHRPDSYGEMDPTWSPNGRWIAFSAIDRLINGRVLRTALWVMRPNGSVQRRLIDDDQIENPSWSPDGHSIAFESNPHAILGVRWDGRGEGFLRVVVLGTQRSRSFGLGAGLDQPSWGPDGILVSQPSWLGGSR